MVVSCCGCISCGLGRGSLEDISDSVAIKGKEMPVEEEEIFDFNRKRGLWLCKPHLALERHQLRAC